jgi:hypothetical protein
MIQVKFTSATVIIWTPTFAQWSLAPKSYIGPMVIGPTLAVAAGIGPIKVTIGQLHWANCALLSGSSNAQDYLTPSLK